MRKVSDLEIQDYITLKNEHVWMIMWTSAGLGKVLDKASKLQAYIVQVI